MWLWSFGTIQNMSTLVFQENRCSRICPFIFHTYLYIELPIIIKSVWQQQKQQNNLYFEKETPPSFKTSDFDKTFKQSVK